MVALLELFAQLTEELSKGKDCGEREVQEACEKCVEKIKVSVQATRTRFLPLSPSFSSRRQSAEGEERTTDARLHRCPAQTIRMGLRSVVPNQASAAGGMR